MSETYADTFRRIVEEEKAAIRAEQEAKSLARQAARKQLENSRQAARAIRDRIVYPMLFTMSETLIQGKLPLGCEVKSSEDSDEFLVVLMAATLENTRPGTFATGRESKPGEEHGDYVPCDGAASHGLRKKFPIKAGVSVIDGGMSLRMSVVVPKGASGPDVITHTKDITEGQDGVCDEGNVTVWYQAQLEECVRRCTRLAADREQP
jgi:hypothetical protein